MSVGAATIPAVEHQIDLERLQQEWSARYGQLIVELSVAKAMIAEMDAKLHKADDADEG